MGKAIKGLFGGVSNKAANKQAYQQQQDRMTEQARILNDRNAAAEGEVSSAGRSRRGRRQLAYRGVEAGLRDKLGA